MTNYHLPKFCLAIADFGSRGYEGIVSDPFEKFTIDRIVDDIVSDEIGMPYRVIEIDTESGTSRDVTGEVADQVAYALADDPEAWEFERFERLEGWLHTYHHNSEEIKRLSYWMNDQRQRRYCDA